MQRRHILGLSLLLVALMLSAFVAVAQDDAEIINEEGGPIEIMGQSDYTFPNFQAFFYEPYIVMSDAAALVDRDPDYQDAEVAQVFGKITSDPFNPPFTFQLSLPIRPLAETRDVDNDGEDDTGVMIFSIGIAENMIADPFQQERDFISGLLSSVILSQDFDKVLEVEGGKLIVYAPDDEQGFPSGFGDDGLVFTEDDPIVTLPQGYTVVDFSSEPFVFDRAEVAEVELFEPEDVEANDFTDLGYIEAFDEMVELYKREYAFTEYKDVDWDALAEEYRPRIEDAEEAEDPFAYQAAVRDFTYEVPDGHLRIGADTQAFQEATAGGLGIAIRELDDGRIITNFITEGGPAQQAGIELRAEIISFDGTPIEEVVENTVTFAGPFSTFDFERLQQLRYSTRFPLAVDEVEVTYLNPGAGEPVTTALPVVEEAESFGFSSFNADLTGFESPLPVELELLENGYGLITIYSFADDLPLTFDLWERALNTLNARGVEGLIIDMRRNGGGSAYMADQLPAYFFDEELNLGYSAFYEEELGDFYYDPELPSEFVLPDEENRYNGEIAVLISPQCASACESFAYNMTLQDRAAIVGQYTTAGLGGSVVPIFLPDGVVARITNGRSLDADGEIHIEGIGVPPTIDVPVNEETLFSEGDPILEAAIEYLEQATTIPTVEAGDIEIGEAVTGELVEGERVRYTLEVTEETVLNFIVGDDSGELDTYLRIYVEGEDQPAIENDDDAEQNTFNSALRGIQVPAGLTLVIEVAGYNDGESGDFFLSIFETGSEPPIVQGGGDDDATTEEDDEDSGSGDTEMGDTDSALEEAEAALEAAREALEAAEDALDAARDAMEQEPSETPEPEPEDDSDDEGQDA